MSINEKLKIIEKTLSWVLDGLKVQNHKRASRTARKDRQVEFCTMCMKDRLKLAESLSHIRAIVPNILQIGGWK